MILFNRVIRTKLPQLISGKKTVKDKAIRERDDDAKVKMKFYADKRRKAKPSEIQVGDIVMLKQKKQTKLSSKFDPVPFRITRIKGTMITVTRNGRYVTRNVSFMKKVNGPSIQKRGEETDDEHSLTSNSSQSLDNTESTLTRRYPIRDCTRVQHYGQNIYDQ